ncbi:hypothetical protein IscW_ISCW004314 [Ixodes scapularis]|uniref:Uncharacterized protein n=1 Tax=Ixodes scapularis TaxID=6945 RepID=B7PER1_IXOSC|nr:hypothetical protein IscW_ISCW004314 [Ixodes scapularis]|eukprot:XP_002433683.1 hypothetical protein IscW_ISCW004314 [Ixodes scapularis]
MRKSVEQMTMFLQKHCSSRVLEMDTRRTGDHGHSLPTAATRTSASRPEMDEYDTVMKKDLGRGKHAVEQFN